ncbi:MAG TPA: carboxypeptidase-like regulatory domain-containing protein, partial [Bryobacteraceae bacterium]|nr:carboxypeptidase-like regulatory domain-containing protein [Bryobacteraceae bacterium]
MKHLYRLAVTGMLIRAGLSGQALTSLSGTVTDPTGAVIPNATVVLENVERGTKRETVSDGAGRYAFLQVQPDVYRITARAPGFVDVAIERVELLVNTPATVNIRFEKVGAVAETVSISAEGVQVNTVDASLGHAL